MSETPLLSNDAIRQLQVACQNYQRVAEASMSVSGQIKKAASQLGYHAQMDCTELDYLILLAERAAETSASP